MSSLVGMALRLTSRRLVEGATFADDRVYDSAIAPIDHMVGEGKSEPFILISTEDEETKGIGGRDITGGHKTIDLVIEIAIAHSVAAQPNAGEGEEPDPVIVIPSTDAALEISLTLIVRQVMRALFSKVDDPWGDLFSRFCLKVEKITNRRGAGNKDGARFAARQIVISIECLQEPDFGHDPAEGEPWGDFLSQLSVDPELSNIEPLIRSTIKGTPEIQPWDRGRADQGLTDIAADHIGIGAAGLVGEEPAELNDGDTDAETGVDLDGVGI